MVAVGLNVVIDDSPAEYLSKHICRLYSAWIYLRNGRQKVIYELKNLPTIIPIQIAPRKPKVIFREKKCAMFV